MSTLSQPVPESKGWARFLPVGVGVVAALLLLGFFQGVIYALVVSAGSFLGALLLKAVGKVPKLF